MTNPPIHDLEMTDTEYASLAVKGYDPYLEQLMMDVDVPPDQARNLTRLVGLTKNKPPETEDEWEKLMSVWEDTSADTDPTLTDKQ